MIRSRDKGFVPNNIQLREVASMCISKYKDSQANALNQLQGSMYHTFSTTAREVLLLKYDTWFCWLLEVEDIIRRDTANAADIIVTISDRVAKEYTEILKSNSDVFDPTFVDIWLEVHAHMYKYLRTKIILLSAEDVTGFFIGITDTLISVMDNTLFELHEIDNLFYSNAPFISFDDICYDYMHIFPGKCLLTLRLNTYEKYFTFDKNICVKDYTKEQTLAKGLPAFLANPLQELGYTVKEII